MIAPYPFSALVGADDLQLALLLNAVSPAVGGVLVRGEKGTAKSTAVRGLAALLPPVAVVAGCPFTCDPAAPDPTCPAGPHAQVELELRPARLVELPVGASEDRLAGSLDLERALVEGRRAFEPGLLARAHRGVLSIDEVNLLGDHLVDLLLDAAAMGVNHVEREGVSVRHAARFQLVGTMNPEEGELRPQLLDRFGLSVEARAPRDVGERAEVVRRRLAYEADPEGFAARWGAADDAVAERIRAARALLPRVVLGEAALRAVVAACTAFEVDGLRADLVTAKAATALAAWSGRIAVTVADVRAAALLALPHRRRRQPFDTPAWTRTASMRPSPTPPTTRAPTATALTARPATATAPTAPASPPPPTPQWATTAPTRRPAPTTRTATPPAAARAIATDGQATAIATGERASATGAPGSATGRGAAATGRGRATGTARVIASWPATPATVAGRCCRWAWPSIRCCCRWRRGGRGRAGGGAPRGRRGGGTWGPGRRRGGRGTSRSARPCAPRPRARPSAAAAAPVWSCAPATYASRSARAASPTSSCSSSTRADRWPPAGA